MQLLQHKKSPEGLGLQIDLKRPYLLNVPKLKRFGTFAAGQVVVIAPASAGAVSLVFEGDAEVFVHLKEKTFKKGGVTFQNPLGSRGGLRYGDVLVSCSSKTPHV